MAHAEPEETLNHALASALPAGTPTEARRRLAVVAAGVLFAAFSVWINYEDDPDLLILDEPTSSLDPLARREFSAVLRELKARGKTILVSSHLLSEVEAICGRVAILKDGAVARSGPLDELLATASVRIHVRRVPPEIIEPLVALGGEVAVAGA